MEYKTTSNRVLIEPEVLERKTSSGLVIPTLTEETNYYGYVRAFGPGRTTKKNVLLPMSINIGDKVMFDPNGSISVRVEERDMVLVKEDDIVMVVDPSVTKEKL